MSATHEAYEQALVQVIDYDAALEQAALDSQATTPAAGETWPERYVNIDTGKPYEPHHDAERAWIDDNAHRYLLAKGGEGGGKSVAGIVRDLNCLRAGINGIMVSPDFEHFKRSLWPEFRRWCPVETVVERERYRLQPTWEPRQPFELHFTSEAGNITTLYCGGIDDPTGWEGPNVGFGHLDEARRRADALALKVLDGRVRIAGPDGRKPQLWLTTTPKKHWLFDFFGPLLENDPFAEFKLDALTITLLTADNEAAGNLAEGFTRQRGQSLTEAEKRVLLQAEWEDIDDVARFLPSIIWWDNCKEDYAELAQNDPIILVADAAYAVGGDTFGLVGLSLHPTDKTRLVVRIVRDYVAKDKKQDFDEIEGEIRDICSSFNVLALGYDPYQLHQMMTRLEKDRVVKTVEFTQGKDRLIADKQLLDFITTRRIAHDGNSTLRAHLDNADRKISQDRNIRIVKRTESMKIDLAVCLSMGVAVAGEWLFSQPRQEIRKPQSQSVYSY